MIVEQARALSPAWRGVVGQVPAAIPEGSVVVLANGEGYMRVSGVYVSIHAGFGREEEMLAVAKALRPFG